MSDEPFHECYMGEFPWASNGPAVSSCYEESSGELWAGNGEYDSRVNYCPKCGYKAQKQVGE